MSRTIRITPGENAGGGRLANAEIHFDDGPLAGLRLTGFALWRGHKGAVKVTLPSKTPCSDTGDFLKPTHPRGSAENLCTAIRQAYRNATAETPQ